jgi:hypothetical protein
MEVSYCWQQETLYFNNWIVNCLWYKEVEGLIMIVYSIKLKV